MLIEKVVSEILVPEGSIVLPARNGPIHPGAFFNNHLYEKGHFVSFGRIWDDFRERILPVLKPVAHIPERTYARCRFAQGANDYEIRRQLPEWHLAQWEDLIGLIEAMYRDASFSLPMCYMEGVGGEVFAVTIDCLVNTRGCEHQLRSWRSSEATDWGVGNQVVYPV